MITMNFSNITVLGVGNNNTYQTNQTAKEPSPARTPVIRAVWSIICMVYNAAKSRLGF